MRHDGAGLAAFVYATVLPNASSASGRHEHAALARIANAGHIGRHRRRQRASRLLTRGRRQAGRLGKLQ
jgi:hypothetical protein